MTDQLRSAVTRALSMALPAAAAALLAACGGSGSAPPAAGIAPAPSAGQVAPQAAAAQVSYYAASRFAEQVSFGPTPALVAEIRSKGFAKWIDDQFALPASQIDVTPYLSFVDPTPSEDWSRYRNEFPKLALSAADQLRLRVSWSLSQFVTLSDRKGDLVGVLYWINLLQQHSLGGYDELLYQTSINRAMGHYLDNDQNRPKSASCSWCAPNENFARELMQLFSLGVLKLNADGTPMRDARGRALETYTQRDVEELARVLTGWTTDPVPPDRPQRNWANWARPMVPSTWPPERDAGAKTVLGRNFPAGQTHAKDLRDAIDMLMAHPNIAPFVAARLIQHLVKSNPTPAYVARMAAVFQNNGHNVKGDLKAVVKAILLDAEARAGDSPATARADDGKLREPFLHRAAMWRGLGCTRFPANQWGPIQADAQRPFSPESVFSFYAPTDRAPGSNLLAPEQKVLITTELQQRFTQQEWARRNWSAQTQTHDLSAYREAGCGIDELIATYQRSASGYIDFLADRYFRGAMPPTLRSNIEQFTRLQYPPWNKNDPSDAPLRLLGFALATPYFGASK